MGIWLEAHRFANRPHPLAPTRSRGVLAAGSFTRFFTRNKMPSPSPKYPLRPLFFAAPDWYYGTSRGRSMALKARRIASVALAH